MKKTLFYLLSLLSVETFAQNLQPTATAAYSYDLNPIDMTYVNLKKLFLKPISERDFVYRSVLESKLNTTYYSIVEDQAQSELHISFKTVEVVTSPINTTSKSETKTKKDGSTYVVTTYNSEIKLKFFAEISLYLGDGTKLITKTAEYPQSYVGSSSTKQGAIDECNNNRSKSQSTSVNYVIESALSPIQNQFLIQRKSVTPYVFNIKSRKQDYTDFNDAATSLKTWFDAGSYDVTSADYTKAMTVIEEGLKEHNPEDRKARVDNEIAAVCLYYQAYAAFVTKDYKKAQELILKSEELDRRIHFTQEGLKDALKLMQERKMF
jgi:hypothetical protein